MRTIIALDDDPGLLRVLAATLKQGGHLPVCYTRFEELRTGLCRVRPALFLLDVQMPYVDGLQVCRWIRGMPEYQTTPVVFLTADARPDAVADAIAAGGSDYLAKPIHPKTLLDRVARHLGRARAA